MPVTSESSTFPGFKAIGGNETAEAIVVEETVAEEKVAEEKEEEAEEDVTPVHPPLVVVRLVNPLARPRGWSSNILDCLDDLPSCLLAHFCPCILLGHNVETMSGGSCWGPCCVSLCCLFACIVLQTTWWSGTPCGYVYLFVVCYSSATRRKLKAQLNLTKGYCCADFLAHLLCHPLALCQEYREMRFSTAAMDVKVLEPPPLQIMETRAQLAARGFAIGRPVQE